MKSTTNRCATHEHACRILSYYHGLSSEVLCTVYIPSRNGEYKLSRYSIRPALHDFLHLIASYTLEKALCAHAGSTFSKSDECIRLEISYCHRDRSDITPT